MDDGCLTPPGSCVSSEVISKSVSNARLVGILLLCMPCLLGTLGLSLMQAGIWQPHGIAIAQSAPVLFVLAAYGPLLLPGAAWLLVTGSRNNRTTPRSLVAWGLLALSIAATVAFHRYIMWSVELP
jgi:hypothetical protein